MLSFLWTFRLWLIICVITNKKQRLLMKGNEKGFSFESVGLLLSLYFRNGEFNDLQFFFLFMHQSSPDV
jgi:hypothetical protein